MSKEKIGKVTHQKIRKQKKRNDRNKNLILDSNKATSPTALYY